MKKIICMIGLLSLWCCISVICSKATFGTTVYGESTSLWQDGIENVQMENASLELVYSEIDDYNGSISDSYGPDLNDNDFGGLSYPMVVLIAIGVFLILLFVGKWAYLAIMLTDYEKFTMQMRDYYYKALVEDVYFPFHDCNAGRFIFNMRVWSVKHALDRTIDPFSHHDYDLWMEDANHKPKVRYT